MASNDDPTKPPTITSAPLDDLKSALKLQQDIEKITKSIRQREEETNKEINKKLKILEDINKVIEKGGKFEGQILTEYELQNKKIEETLKINDLKTKKAQILLDSQRQIVAAAEKELQLLNNAKETDTERIQQAKEALEIAQANEKEQKSELEKLESSNEEVEKIAIIEKRRNDLAISFGESQAQAFKNYTGIGRESTTIIGRMIQLNAQGINYKESLKEAGQAIAKQLTPANLLAAAIDKIGDAVKALINITINYAKEQDKAYASFEKTAGDVKAFKGEIESLKAQTGAYGITIGDASKTLAQFKNEFNGFTAMSIAQRAELAKTSAQLGVLGVAEGDVIKTQELLVKGMGMTVTQSTDLQKSLYGTAVAMGLPPQKVSAEFAKAAPQLAAHGRNMMKVFLDLENNAKNTGIAFDRLLAITQKFDTFEGAADSAGKLNAILGGDYLNSIELLNASEGERVRIMQDSLRASGKSIEQMSKQEQRAMAQALGLQDVTELQKLMNNETTKGTVETMRAEEAQKKMNEAMQNAQELGEMWSKLLTRLAIPMRPIIEALKSLITVINEFIDEHPNVAVALGIIAVGFTVVLGAIAAFLVVGYMAVSFMATLKTALGTAGPAAGKSGKEIGQGLRNMSGGVRALGNSLKGIGGSLVQFGFAMLLIGAGVAIAAIGMSLLVKAFSGLGDAAWPAVAAIIAISAAFVIFALIMSSLISTGIGPAAVALLYAFGGAILMIGAGVALGAAGLALMVASIAKFGALAAKNIPALSLALITLAYPLLFVSVGLVAFGAALAFSAFGAALAVGPLMLIAIAFLMLGAAVNIAAAGIGIVATSIATMFESLNKSSPENISKSIKALFDSISVTGLVSLGSFSLAVSKLNDELSNLNSNLSSIVKNMADLDGVTAKATVTMQSAGVVNTAPASTVSTTTAAARASSVVGGSTAGSSNIIPVAIYIDSKKVGEILDPRYANMIKDKLNKLDSKVVPA